MRSLSLYENLKLAVTSEDCDIALITIPLSLTKISSIVFFFFFIVSLKNWKFNHFVCWNTIMRKLSSFTSQIIYIHYRFSQLEKPIPKVITTFKDLWLFHFYPITFNRSSVYFSDFLVFLKSILLSRLDFPLISTTAS